MAANIQHVINQLPPVQQAALAVRMEHRRAVHQKDDGTKCGQEEFEPVAVKRGDDRDLVYCRTCRGIVWRQGDTADLVRDA